MSSVPPSHWRQGSIVPHGVNGINGDTLQLARPLESEALLILISQDCDIICYSYELEPYVEVLVARPVAEEDGSAFHGKSPRRFQLYMEGPAGRLLYEINAVERSKVDRHLLVDIEPAAQPALAAETVLMLARWVARRYTRPAFPDEFNRRYRTASEKINRKLKVKGQLITGIYLRLDSLEELSSDQSYSVIVRITMTPSNFEDVDTVDEALNLMGELTQALNRCEGIDVEDSELVSEDDFSLSDIKLSLRLDTDYLSYRDANFEDINPEA